MQCQGSAVHITGAQKMPFLKEPVYSSPLPQGGDPISLFTLQPQQILAEYNEKDSNHISGKLKGMWWPLFVFLIYHIFRSSISNRYPMNYYCALYCLASYRAHNLKYVHSNSKASLMVYLTFRPISVGLKEMLLFPIWSWSFLSIKVSLDYPTVNKIASGEIFGAEKIELWKKWLHT